MAKLSEITACKTVKDLEELGLSNAGLEKAKELLEQKKPAGYKQTIKLIDKKLAADEPEVEEDEKPAKKTTKTVGKGTSAKPAKKEEKKATTSKKAPAKKEEPEEPEEYEMLGNTYVPVELDKDDFKTAINPPTNVLLLVDEGKEEVTVFTPVWAGDKVITLIDLSVDVDRPLEIEAPAFFKGKLKSPVEEFSGEIVALLIDKDWEGEE